MKSAYKTVKNEVSIEYVEKKSRFIAHVKPVSTEEEAVSFINSIKSKYWDARHNVYAYSVRQGAGGGVSSSSSNASRYSDDGEPQGTAGIPVLEVIKKNELSNIVIVVTRYFGGILLGASGLVRAYGKSASAGIEAAGIVDKILCDIVCVKIPYTLSGKLQTELKAKEYFIKEIKYNENVSIFVYVKKGFYEIFEKYIIEVTNSLCDIEKYHEEYLTL